MQQIALALITLPMKTLEQAVNLHKNFFISLRTITHCFKRVKLKM